MIEYTLVLQTKAGTITARRTPEQSEAADWLVQPHPPAMHAGAAVEFENWRFARIAKDNYGWVEIAMYKQSSPDSLWWERDRQMVADVLIREWFADHVTAVMLGMYPPKFNGDTAG